MGRASKILSEDQQSLEEGLKEFVPKLIRQALTSLGNKKIYTPALVFYYKELKNGKSPGIAIHKAASLHKLQTRELQSVILGLEKKAKAIGEGLLNPFSITKLDLNKWVFVKDLMQSDSSYALFKEQGTADGILIEFDKSTKKAVVTDHKGGSTSATKAILKALKKDWKQWL